MGLGDLAADRGPRGVSWPPACWRWASNPSSASAIASSTRYEWILADLAIMCAGAATTTVYSSTNASDTAYILNDSECRIVFAEDAAQLAKLTDHRPELPNLDQGGAVRRPRRRRLGDHPDGPR